MIGFKILNLRGPLYTTDSSPVTPKLWTDLWLVYSIPEIKSVYNICICITVLYVCM